MTYLLGIDVGTTNAKVLAADVAGRTYAATERRYPLHEPTPGHREQDPLVLRQAVEEAVRAAVDQAGGLPVALGVSTAMHSLMAVDAAGRPLTPLITWADTRAHAYATALRDQPAGRQLYAATGVPIHPMTPLCKLAWLRDQQPALFAAAARFVSFKEFLLFSWFGTWVVDHAIASATGLFNRHTRTWDADALRYAGVTPDRLSVPVPTTHTLRHWQPGVAAALGLPAHVPLVVGASDGCLANVAAGSDGTGRRAVVSLGTSGAIRLTTQRPQTDPRARIFDYLLTDTCHVVGGATNNGGVVLEWLQKSFFPDLPDLSAVVARAAAVAAGADGLLCVPYFYGERAPWWEGQARGLFLGVRSLHTRDHFARAALEGIILNLRAVGRALEEVAGPFETISADGGLTRSDLVGQLLADVFGKPVVVANRMHGPVYGAIRLAGWALGLTPELFADPPAEMARTFVPHAAHHARYTRRLDVFEQAYLTTRPPREALNADEDAG